MIVSPCCADVADNVIPAGADIEYFVVGADVICHVTVISSVVPSDHLQPSLRDIFAEYVPGTVADVVQLTVIVSGSKPVGVIVCSVPLYTNDVFSGTSDFSGVSVHTALSVIFSVTGVPKLYSEPLFLGSAGLDAVFPLSTV